MSYLLLFLGQGLNFLLAVINIRAASKGLIKWTAASDFIISLVSFVLIQHIAKANNTMEIIAYASGGAVGSAIAILITRSWDATR